MTTGRRADRRRVRGLVVAAALAIASCASTRLEPARHERGPPRAFSLVEVATGRPDATVDLGDDDDARRVAARWRHTPVEIVEVPGVVLGVDGRPIPSADVRTHDIRPRPRRDGWNEAPWQDVAPREIGVRRGHGHLSMGWMRLELTLPERLGEVDIHGAVVSLEVIVDDYAEVWVDGRLPHRLGDRGGHVIAGWNAANRVVLTTDAEPGARFDVAMLLVNGPISRSPANFHWIRRAFLDVHRPRSSEAVRSLESDLRRVVGGPAHGAFVERIAAGFADLTGLAIDPADGSVLVGDLGARSVHRFDPATGALTTVLTHIAATALAYDVEGRLVVRLADGRVVRHERNGETRTLEDEQFGREPTSGMVDGEPIRAVASDPLGSLRYLATPHELWRVRSDEARLHSTNAIRP